MTSLLVVLKMGFHVELIVTSENPCKTSSCIDETINTLRIKMTTDNFSIRVIETYKDLSRNYDLFYVNISISLLYLNVAY